MAFSAWRTWVTGETVTAAHMNQEVRDNGEALFPDAAATVDWDPVLEATVTDPNGSRDGARYQIGAVEFVWVRFTFSDIAAPYGDGTYFVTLPNDADNITSSATAGSGSVVGTWSARDSSGPDTKSGPVTLRSGTTVQFELEGGGIVGSDSPWLWAGNDVLSFEARIPIA